MSNMIAVLPSLTCLGVEVPSVVDLFRWNGDLDNAPDWLKSAEDPPGQRFHRYGFGVNRNDDGSWWWIAEQRRWAEWDEMKAIGLGGSSCARCRTFKALRRHVRKHWAPGIQFLWGGRFGGRVIVI